MSAKKLRYHHGDLAGHISQIAWEKVLQHGADKLSLRSCARDAGVDPAAVYRHFKSREDLLAHLGNRAFGELSTSMEMASTQSKGSQPREALVQIGLAYIRYATAKPHIFQMMFDLAGRSKTAHLSGASAEGSQAYEILVRGITELKPMSDIDVHIFTLWSSVHGFSKLAIAGLGPDPADLDRVSRSICEKIVATIT